MKPTVPLLIAAAILGAASPALACRAAHVLTEAEIWERTVVFTARVESLDRTPEGDGHTIRATLRPLRTIHGEPPAIVVAEDYVPSDDPADGYDEVVVYCGGRFWFGDELAALAVGDEVAVRGARGTSGDMSVNDLGRTGGERARRILDAPRP